MLDHLNWNRPTGAPLANGLAADIHTSSK